MYRKGVSAVIKNGKGEFLLVNLQSFAEKYYAILGGGLDKGESLEQAAYREIEEELGIASSKLKLSAKTGEPLRFTFKEIKLHRDGNEYKGSERYFFGFDFLGNEEDIKVNDDEVRKYKWVALKDLDKYLLFDNQLEETCEQIEKLFGIIKPK